MPSTALISSIASVLVDVLAGEEPKLISYSDLIKRMKSDMNPRNLDKPLGELSSFCKENGMPLISSIVVNKDTLMPGAGYFKYYFPGLGEKEQLERYFEELKRVQEYDNWSALPAMLKSSAEAAASAKKAQKIRSERRMALCEKWEHIYNALKDEGELSCSGFKTVFVETWRYFLDFAQDRTVDREDLALYRYLCGFALVCDYPECITHWEFDVCLRLADALARSLAQNNDAPHYPNHGFTDGVIEAEVYEHTPRYLNIADFEEFFTSLAEEYHEDAYCDE